MDPPLYHDYDFDFSSSKPTVTCYTNYSVISSEILIHDASALQSILPEALERVRFNLLTKLDNSFRLKNVKSTGFFLRSLTWPSLQKRHFGPFGEEEDIKSVVSRYHEEMKEESSTSFIVDLIILFYY